jgi:hypothetical protein
MYSQSIQRLVSLQAAPLLIVGKTFLGEVVETVRRNDQQPIVEEQFADQLLAMQQDKIPPLEKDQNDSLSKISSNCKFLKILLVINAPDYSTNLCHYL